MPAAVLALVLAMAPTARAAAPPDWAPGVRAAAEWAGQRAGTVSFAVRTEQALWGRRLDRQVQSASVIKAMLLVAYLRRPQVRGRALRPAERALLAPMVRRSDNVAATRVRDLVGNAVLARFARRVGMARFVVDPVWGRSLITARDQTAFFLRIDRTLPRRHRAYGMRLLRTIVARQRWGVPRAVPEGWAIYFKGGWGDGSGTVKHQVALLRRGPLRVALAVLITGSPTDAYGRQTLEGVARRLLRGLDD